MEYWKKVVIFVTESSLKFRYCFFTCGGNSSLERPGSLNSCGRITRGNQWLKGSRNLVWSRPMHYGDIVLKIRKNFVSVQGLTKRQEETYHRVAGTFKSSTRLWVDNLVVESNGALPPRNTVVRICLGSQSWSSWYPPACEYERFIRGTLRKKRRGLKVTMSICAEHCR